MCKPFTVAIGFLLAALLVFPHPRSDASQEGEITDSILNSAETFFLSLKGRNFESAWNILSAKSRESIINDVYTTSVEIGVSLKRDDIVRDFQRKGVMFRNYWTSFHRRFDTDIVLERSLWKMGTVQAKKAEIIIQYKKFRNPTILKMFKENNAWKVGLNETFSRGTIEKVLDYLKIMHGV